MREQTVLNESPNRKRQTVADPVCGMTVDPESAAGSFDFEGETYYFCSLHCLEKFREDPERFLNKPVQPLMIHPVGIGRERPQHPSSNPVASTTPSGLPAWGPRSAPGSDKSEPVATAPGSDRTIYTCPMHPEVRKDKPSSCPKCGMALEPVTPAATQTKTEYTCPMHPQIVRDAPGSCPICGMALEPRTVSLGEAENPELVDMRLRFGISVALTTPLVLMMLDAFLPGQPLHRLLPFAAANWLV